MSGEWFSEPTAGVVVRSSNGDDAYHVWAFGRKMECECATYRALRRPCKHMDVLRECRRLGEAVPGAVLFFDNDR